MLAKGVRPALGSSRACPTSPFTPRASSTAAASVARSATPWPTNRVSFYAIAEGFLSQCLGGRYEPIGNDFKGANLKVLEGAENVPGLADALK